jgi:hypothetical protein
MAVLLSGWALVGCTTTGIESPRPPADAPPQAAIDAGNAAISALQGRLFQRLSEEMGKGGPSAAVTACRDEAQALTARVAAEQGIEVGRTSHRLRNPGNAPREWVKPYLAQWAGKKASEVQPVVVDLGERVGILRPIPTAELCTTCHGAPDRIAPEVKGTLQQAYPEDRATGFSPGDLRGLFWAEVPRSIASRKGE